MHRRVRHLAAIAAATLALASSAVPAGAAVVADGTVTVTFRALALDDSVSPIAEAQVELAAYVTDFDPPLFEDTAVTDANGRAVFTGVPREDGDGPAIHLVAAAALERVTTDDHDCVTTQAWNGTVDGTLSAAAVEIVIDAPELSSIECPPQVVLAGRVLGSSGQPLDIKAAAATIVVPPAGGAQAFVLDVAGDGAFEIGLPASGTHEEPAVVTVEISGTRSVQTPDDPRCFLVYTAEVTWTTEVALADGDELPFLELVAPEVLEGEACEGPVVTLPPTGPDGESPTVTLPATDSGPANPGLPAPIAAVVVAALLLVVATLLAALRPRRRTG